MKRDKLFMITVSSVVGGLFGGLVSVIQDSLFKNNKNESLSSNLKTFGQGFLIGSVMSGLSEFVNYDNREKFKDEMIEQEIKRRLSKNNPA